MQDRGPPAGLQPKKAQHFKIPGLGSICADDKHHIGIKNSNTETRHHQCQNIEIRNQTNFTHVLSYPDLLDAFKGLGQELEQVAPALYHILLGATKSDALLLEHLRFKPTR